MAVHGLDRDARKVPPVWLAPHLRDPRDPQKDGVPEPAWLAGRFDPAALQDAFAARKAVAVLRQARDDSKL